MIVREHLDCYNRLSPGFRPRMLMLGAQQSTIPEWPARKVFAHWVGNEYDELDLDGGDLHLDLHDDLEQLAGKYASVFNLGTLEHCWDAHRAWSNALRAVAVGGSFMTHSPIGGWVNGDGCLDHGVHMTTRAAIERFLGLNGFAVMDSWQTQWRERGQLLWLRAEKQRHIERLADFEPVLQAYVRGDRPSWAT